MCFKLGLPWKGNFPARIQQVFDRFDKDGGGSLDRTELQPLGRKAERMERMEACRTGLVADSRLISFRLQKDSLSFWISGLEKGLLE